MEQNDAIFANLVEQELIPCPNCGRTKSLTAPRNFNLMFETYIGPVKDAANAIYLASRNGAGNFREFYERLAIGAAKNSVRDLPDREIVPKRDQHEKFSLPHQRVRTNGDAILLQIGQ